MTADGILSTQRYPIASATTEDTAATPYLDVNWVWRHEGDALVIQWLNKFLIAEINSDNYSVQTKNFNKQLLLQL